MNLSDALHIAYPEAFLGLSATSGTAKFRVLASNKDKDLVVSEGDRPPWLSPVSNP